MDVKQCISMKFKQNIQYNTNDVRYYRIHQHTVLLKQTSKYTVHNMKYDNVRLHFLCISHVIHFFKFYDIHLKHVSH